METPYSVQITDEWFSCNGEEGREVRLWHESGDLIAIAYYHDAESGVTGYQKSEEYDPAEGLYRRWEDCLEDQALDYDDYETIRSAIHGG